VENNPNMPAIEIVQKFNLASLSCIMKKKQSIVDEVKCVGKQIEEQNIKSSPCNEMEKVLIEWFEGMRLSDLLINGTLIKDKRESYQSGQKVNFKASNGWLGRFKKCHGLTYKNFCWKSASVGKKTVKIILFLM
jgi:hypothetical protein